jgi:hypothetical protein
MSAVDRGFMSWLGHFRLSRVMSAVDRGFMSWLGHFRLSRVMSVVDCGFKPIKLVFVAYSRREKEQRLVGSEPG